MDGQGGKINVERLRFRWSRNFHENEYALMGSVVIWDWDRGPGCHLAINDYFNVSSGTMSVDLAAIFELIINLSVIWDHKHRQTSCLCFL
jgi:hypothetical protein